MSLTSDIIEILLSGKDEDVEEALFKSYGVANNTENYQFRLWINKELEGYGYGDKLPSYRTVEGKLFADILYGDVLRKDCPIYVPLSGYADFDEMFCKVSFSVPVSDIVYYMSCDESIFGDPIKEMFFEQVSQYVADGTIKRLIMRHDSHSLSSIVSGVRDRLITFLKDIH